MLPAAGAAAGAGIACEEAARIGAGAATGAGVGAQEPVAVKKPEFKHEPKPVTTLVVVPVTPWATDAAVAAQAAKASTSFDNFMNTPRVKIER
jgi:hypothetical protein